MRSYKIIGGDGREYGPVSLEEIQLWIREGRINSATMIWRDDLAAWAPASRYAELVSDLGPVDAGVAQSIPIEDCERVGFWSRLGAYIIDMLLLSVVFTILALPWKAQIQQAQQAVFSPNFGQDLEKTTHILLQFGTVWFFQSLLSMTYFICMNGKLGATVGKLIIGARIVEDNGSPIGFRKATSRYFFEVLSFALFGIGYLMIGFREDKRGLHDLLAKTCVIYKRNDRLVP